MVSCRCRQNADTEQEISKIAADAQINPRDEGDQRPKVPVLLKPELEELMDDDDDDENRKGRENPTTSLTKS